jgi:hypothetical protein
MTKQLADIPPRELALLYALACMCEQYLPDTYGYGTLDHMCAHAGVWACTALLEYGLVDTWERGAKWTALGRELLDLGYDSIPKLRV